MALIAGPQLLIADEPTTALDVTVQAQVLRRAACGCASTGLAIVMITHDLGVVAGVADRVAVMYAGRIVETADAAALFAAPRHPYTAALLASIPRLRTMRRNASSASKVSHRDPTKRCPGVRSHLDVHLRATFAAPPSLP